MPDMDVIESRLFDHQLISGSNYNPEILTKLNDWVRITSVLQKEESTKIIAFLINHYLKDSISERGLEKIDKIEENLLHLENILATTKGGLSKKFYRDHINHTLRVFLMSNYIMNNIPSIQLSVTDKDKIALASIFHDISYPLSEVFEIYNSIIKSMNEIYDSVKFPSFLVTDNLELIGEMLQLINNDPYLTPHKLCMEINNKNHGALSALEFLSYLIPEKRVEYREMIKSIVLHDSACNNIIDFNLDNITPILIISDELQDWDRVSSHESKLTITEISNFQIKNEIITGEIKWNNTSVLSPLRQILSKQSNLQRIINSKISLKIKYTLPVYEKIELIKFEKILSKIIKKHVPYDELFKDRISMDEFEKKRYGVKGIEDEEMEPYLTRYKMANSHFRDCSIFYSQLRNELWVTNKDIITPDSIELILNKDIILNLKGNDVIKKGLLKSIHDQEVNKIHKIISKELSIFYDISSDKINAPPYRLTATKEKYTENLKSLGLRTEEITLCTKMYDTAQTLRDGGLFQFN